MTNYQHAKIYKITSLGTSNIYIGSTTQKLNDRLYNHISNYNKYLNGNIHYFTSYEILKHDDHKIELIENYPCENKNDLLKKEQEYLDFYENICVNKQKAYTGLSKPEYNKQHYRLNKDKILEQNKEYYQNNKENIQLKRKKKITCECGSVVCRNVLARHKRTKKHINFINNN